MKLLTDSTPIVQLGNFVEPAGAQLRSVVSDDALTIVWNEVGKCYGYPKPDGWRIQIHKIGNDVFLFSRSGKNWTAEFPALVELIRDRVKDDVILDTELVGFNEYGSHLGPSKLRQAPQYRCYLLDALYLNGKSMVDLPTRERIPLIWECLRDALSKDDQFTLAGYKEIHSENDLADMYRQCRARQKEGFDGLILKLFDTSYFTDVFKVKPEETIDAVVIGADRDKQGDIKTLLLAVPSHKHNSWVPITKVTKKSTDWNAVWPACEECILPQRPERLEEPPTPSDVWFAPEVVVTISFTSLEPGTGYRIHVFAARNCVLREDKSPKEATSFEQLLEMAHLDEPPEPIKRAVHPRPMKQAARLRQLQPSLF